MTETETWAPVPHFPGYKASTKQRVKRMPWQSDNGRQYKERIIQNYYYNRDANGTYMSAGPYIRFIREDKLWHVSLAIVLAMTFIDREYDTRFQRVELIDGNPHNTDISNLRIVAR